MFDFLKKKLNKTIKDASESTEEEMTQHDKEFAKDLDNLEEAFSSIEDKYSKDSSDEEKVEDVSDEDEKTIPEDGDEKEDSVTDESTEVEETAPEAEEDSSVEESAPEESEDIDESKVDEESASDDEETIDKEDEESGPEDTDEDTQEEGEKDTDKKDSEKSDTVDKQKTEETKKGRFSFFRRNKKEEEKPEESDEEDEKVEEDIAQDEEDTSEDTSDDVTEDTSSTDESTEETKEEEKKEEKKGRFSFFRRNKKEEEKTEETKTEEKTETTEETPQDEEDKKEPAKQAKKDEEESGGMFSFITKKTIKEDDISDILDELFMSLLEGDVAYEVADRIVESVKEDLIGKKIQRRGDMELFTTNALKKAITEIIDNGSFDLLGEIEKSKQNGEPYKIMFVGINGTGKTTTIAKMATYLEKHGYSSVFGASDTFRAGAIEQLEHHAKKLNLKIIKHERNSDPAAVAYDAVEHAKATGKNVVLIDTSGRMQTNANLMDEMKKIKRVSQPDFVMYVGDALMGNDATEQATKFNEVIDIDGIILTKADADAKGGAALSIGHVIHKPILFIGTGQSYDDLMEFKPEWMINLIFEE